MTRVEDRACRASASMEATCAQHRRQAAATEAAALRRARAERAGLPLPQPLHRTA
ncbi:hypothetical protein [Streptomyces sp. NPDC000405]|uniref:hypothetical protein n=1 Tax=Streptomyces sp. NPDC000405 TaxID=3161033 RepID=UPI00398D539E